MRGTRLMGIMFRYFGEIVQLLGRAYILWLLESVMMLLRSIIFTPMSIRLNQGFIDSEQRLPETAAGRDRGLVLPSRHPFPATTCRN